MPDTITISAGYDSNGYPIKQTLAVGDRVVIESVAVVTRILGGSRSPYMEVRRPDGRLQLFNEAGTELGRDHYSVNEHLRPFVSDEAEAAHAAAVRQYKRGQEIASAMNTHPFNRFLAEHPELIADCEALLARIADVTKATK